MATEKLSSANQPFELTAEGKAEATPQFGKRRCDNCMLRLVAAHVRCDFYEAMKMQELNVKNIAKAMSPEASMNLERRKMMNFPMIESERLAEICPSFKAIVPLEGAIEGV